MSSERKSVSFKLIVLGDSGVGKTSLVIRQTRGQFSYSMAPTIGASHMKTVIPIDDYDVELKIWDTAGQEQFASLVPMYARGAQIAVIVFDVSNPDTYDTLQSWIDSSRNEYLIPKILCAANKIDLEYNEDAIKKIEASLYEQKIPLFKVSAKNGSFIDELFYEIGQEEQEEVTPMVQTVVEFKEPVAFREKKKKCC